MSEVVPPEVKELEHDQAHDAEVAHDAELPSAEGEEAANAGGYDFMKTLALPPLPWPAWEIAHKPLLVFNSAKYADLNYKYFSAKPSHADAQPTAAQLEWAGEYVVKVKGFRGEEAVPYDANQLAKAMVVGESKAIVGTFPKVYRSLTTCPSSVGWHWFWFASWSVSLVAVRPINLSPMAASKI